MAIFKGDNYIVETVNQPMLNLMGINEKEILNKPLFDALPNVKEQGLDKILSEVYSSGNPFNTSESPFYIIKNGEEKLYFFNYIYEPFFDINGKVDGVTAAAVDVTEQVKARLKIEVLEQRSRLAIDSANIGTYDIDLSTNGMILSERFMEIFDLTPTSTRDQLIQKYHPDDKHIRDAGLKEALEKGNSSYEVRLLKKDKSILWVRCNGKILYDHDNNPSRLIGTVLDITPIMEVQRQKDDFLAIASHELKTPLTSVKAYSQILSSLIKNGDQVTSLNLLKKQERQIDKMSKLVHNFLDLSRLESSRLVLQKEVFDINDLVYETINYYNLPENKERLKLEKGILPEINADKTKVGHVIDNILSNALKYSPANKPVVIKTEFSDGHIIVSVQDFGKGIDEKSKDKIFQRFYRAENVQPESVKGFGIGLYYSSELVRLHKGKMWFDSEENVGSTFTFSLPVKD